MEQHMSIKPVCLSIYVAISEDGPKSQKGLFRREYGTNAKN